LIADARSGPFCQRGALSVTAHRPWPLPSGPWVMGQTWRHLLFAHWRVPPEALARVMPPQLPPDVRDGAAWIGVTPFVVTAAHPRGLPPLPWVSSFPECNVRTYVTVDGRPGIYFFSLDAARRLACDIARLAYRVPYFHADMGAADRDGWITYAARRIQRDGPPAGLEVRYRAVGAPFDALPGSLEHFLCERYCLYTLDRRQRVLRAEIHHRPWHLYNAEAEFPSNTMTGGLGIELQEEPTLHLSRRQDVVFWPLGRARANDRRRR
jgi:uncharacterized protein YqjF (DUF2071 family)